MACTFVEALFLDWGQVVEGGVQAAGVVPALDPADDCLAGLGPGGEAPTVDEFPLEGSEERLRGAVVEADPGGAHRLAHAELFAALAVLGRGVLTTPIGVEHDPVD